MCHAITLPDHPAGPERKANAPLLPASMGTAACKTLSTTVSGDTLTHTAQCAIGSDAADDGADGAQRPDRGRAQQSQAGAERSPHAGRAATLRKVVNMLENQDSLPAQHKSSGTSRWTRIADSRSNVAPQR